MLLRLLILLLLSMELAWAETPPRHVLVITTSTAQMPEANWQTGVWLQDIATAYVLLTEKGFGVDFVSIDGGMPPMVPASIPVEGNRFVVTSVSDRQRAFYSTAFLNNLDALAAVNSARKITDLTDWQKYDAVFLAGGYGAFWDFIDNWHLQRVLQGFVDDGKIIAATGVGVSALLKLHDKDYRPFLSGRHITGFSDAEIETIRQTVSLTTMVPHSIESRAKALGAFFHKNPVLYKPKVVIDENLLTGQNPASNKALVDALIAKMVDNKNDGFLDSLKSYFFASTNVPRYFNEPFSINSLPIPQTKTITYFYAVTDDTFLNTGRPKDENRLLSVNKGEKSFRSGSQIGSQEKRIKPVIMKAPNQ